MMGGAVALHPEGVDRNMDCAIRKPCALVALHPEGVDRNFSLVSVVLVVYRVALHPEGVDRNCKCIKITHT